MDHMVLEALSGGVNHRTQLSLGSLRPSPPPPVLTILIPLVPFDKHDDPGASRYER